MRRRDGVSTIAGCGWEQESRGIRKDSDHAITTFQDEGEWWARARVTEKEAGGDRPALGGPCRNRLEAKAAAETFCDGRKAG